MGNSQSYQSKIPEVNQVYEIYRTSFKNNKIKSSYNQYTDSKTAKILISQLFESFQPIRHHHWAAQIKPLFLTHFLKSFQKLWAQDLDKFYKLLVKNQQKKLSEETYQQYFYRQAKNFDFRQSSFKDTKQKLKALNSSLIDEKDQVPILGLPLKNKHKQAQKINDVSSIMTENYSCETRFKSCNIQLSEGDINQPLFLKEFQSQLQTNRQVKSNQDQIERSSIIIPQTVFINRLEQSQKQQVLEMLQFYKQFSKALQQLIKSVSLISCPIKHFEACLKKKLHDKKILKQGLKSSVVNSQSKKNYLKRKKQQYNNKQLLMQLRNFLEAYTQFIWKYLGLYQIQETQYKLYINVQTVYGIVLKVVWGFVSWIGNRGYQYQEMQLPKVIKKLKFNSQNDNIPQYIINLGCLLSKQTCPQRYLKKVVLIYRELSKNCDSADSLINSYETLIDEIIRQRCCQRLLRMHNIINCILKVDEGNGQIGYAWTTWSIMIQLFLKQLDKEDRDIAKEKGFDLIIR